MSHAQTKIHADLEGWLIGNPTHRATDVALMNGAPGINSQLLPPIQNYSSGGWVSVAVSPPVVETGIVPGWPLTRTTVILSKPSLKGLEAIGHLAHDLVGDLAVAFGVALQADGEGDVEEDGVDFVAEALGHLDPLLALVWAQVGRVHVVPRHLRDQPCPQ